MKPCADTPCKQCPMRRKSMPGWLGSDVPEHFIQVVHSEANMPCHLTVDYAEPGWEDQLAPGGDARACAGVAIYRANVGKLPRDASVRRLKPDKKTVFASPREFVEHHRSTGIVSGELLEKDHARNRSKASARRRR